MPLPHSCVRRCWVKNERSGASGNGFASDAGPERPIDGPLSTFPSTGPDEGSHWLGEAASEEDSKNVSEFSDPRPPVPTTPAKRLFQWFDQRTGLDELLREGLDEPIPGGARFAYVFGSALLFIFISQVITGVFLALYYVPSADH